MACQPRIALLSAIALLVWSSWAAAQTQGQHQTQAAGSVAAKPAQCLEISPSSLRFGEQKIGTPSPPQTVLVSNGTSSSQQMTLAIAGDFEMLEPTSPQTLAPGASVAAVVRFKPHRDGEAPGVLTVQCKGAKDPQTVALWGITPGWLGMISSNALFADVALAVLLCALYWLAMVVARWNRVATPTRFVLRAQVASVKAELDALLAAASANPPVPVTHAADLIDAATNLVKETGTRGNRFLDFLFWSRGQEMTGWSYTYEAQKRMVPLLPEPTVRARLEAAAAQLALEDDPPSRTLADTAKSTLAQQSPSLDRLRALLAEALGSTYDREYNTYADLVSWQNKTAWLVSCGLLLIVVLTAAFPTQSILFLVGATGGLLSRLSRSLDRKDAPTDYGASWTTLFLSPVAGALGAWVGILIATLAVQLQILSSGLNVGWLSAHEPMTLAVALVFGFSERLLDTVFDKLDTKVLNQATKPSSAATPARFAIVDPGPLTGTLQQTGTHQLLTTGATGKVAWTIIQPVPPPSGLTVAANTGVLTWGPPLPKGPISITVQAVDATTQATAVQLLMLQIS
jgi:hypothetical protein